MAILKESSIGASLTGGVGEVYYRNQNGKKVVCSMPTEYHIPMDKASVERRDKMKRLMSISKAVTKEPFFRPLWKRNDIRGVAGYHKFLSFNHPHNEQFSLDKVKICPIGPAFSVTIKEAYVSNKNLFVSLDALSADCGIDFKREQFIGAGGFIVLSNGPVETSEEIYTVALTRQNLSASVGSELNFELKSETKDTYKFENFENMSALIMFSSLNSEEQPVKHSDTFLVRL